MKPPIPIRHLPSPPRYRRALLVLAIYTASGLVSLGLIALAYSLLHRN